LARRIQRPNEGVLAVSNPHATPEQRKNFMVFKRKHDKPALFIPARTVTCGADESSAGCG
jgi:hypothetical protein